ncbi:hypothetical protein OJHNALOF_01840 [Oceanimonas sp. MB9]|nr:hypothetical protein [Oceanimonas sp. MB9]
MDNNNFFDLLRSLTHLTPPQLERANEHIASHLRRDLLIQVLAERHERIPECPHCCSKKVIHWGHYKNIPRYRCKECLRTFNQLHNTSLVRLKHMLSKGSVLCTDGNPSYIRIAKKSTGINHKRLISLDKCRVIDGVFHIQTLNSYVSRWRLWMGRFYGVGTAYLQNYLAWFRIIEHQQSSCSS